MFKYPYYIIMIKYLFYTTIVLCTLLYLYHTHVLNGMGYIQSKIDQLYYRVRNQEDETEAADTLAKINARVDTLLTYFKEKKMDEQKNVKRLLQNYNPRRLHERPVDSRFPAYSIDKGEDIFICVREQNRGKVMKNINSIMYVMLHELAHIMTVSVGHTVEFWTNYDFLIKHAIEARVYHYEDYTRKNVMYCDERLQ